MAHIYSYNVIPGWSGIHTEVGVLNFILQPAPAYILANSSPSSRCGSEGSPKTPQSWLWVGPAEPSLES